MDTQTDGRDLKLLESDKYTFAMLRRILNDSCRLTMTDHKRLIICHSSNPFPVWIWTPDDASSEEKERAWDAVMQACPITDGYRYNLKYDLAEFFLSRAREQGMDAAIAMNMFAYECPKPLAPENEAAGHIHLCTWEDLDEAAEIIKAFHGEIAIDKGDDDNYLISAKELIKDNRLFFWKDNFNQTVASCSYTPNGDFASVGSVYTLPAYRRMHYAENLVYQVTEILAGMGAIPILYANADYEASNACYEKIGFVLRGKLCTIGVKDFCNAGMPLTDKSNKRSSR